jgi:hypothetical protein
VEAHLFKGDGRLFLVGQLGEHSSAIISVVGEEVELGASQDEWCAWAMVRDLWHPLLTTSSSYPSENKRECHVKGEEGMTLVLTFWKDARLMRLKHTRNTSVCG